LYGLIRLFFPGVLLPGIARKGVFCYYKLIINTLGQVEGELMARDGMFERTEK